MNLGWRNKGSDVFLIFVSLSEVTSVCCSHSETPAVGTEAMECVPVKVVFVLWHGTGGLLLLGWELGSRAGVRCAFIRDIMSQGFFDAALQ